MQSLGWAAFAVSATVVAGLLALTMLAVLDQFPDGIVENFRCIVEVLPMRVVVATLLACGLVAAGTLSQRPAAPPGVQAGQRFDVVVGCAIDQRTEMPTLFEQGMAHAGCYFVTLYAAVTPQCETVPTQNPMRPIARPSGPVIAGSPNSGVNWRCWARWVLR